MSRIAIFAVCLLAAVAGGSVAAADSGPMADAGLDQTVTVDTTVQLDATGSYHPNGEITAYEWTITTPDGQETTPDCTECERTQFTPETTGRYEVSVTITDEDREEVTDTLFVYVEDAGPNVELSGETEPDTGESIDFEAAAESPDAELEEIVWAVNDRAVAVQSLEEISDQSTVPLTFVVAETHRVQVVVQDSNGRTAYDQLFVQPQGEDTIKTGSLESTGAESTDSESDCSDPQYNVLNFEECNDITIEDPEPDPETTPVSRTAPEEIRYETDGYSHNLVAGMQARDSTFIGTETEGVGLDDGENAPWEQGTLGYMHGPIDSGSTFLFGQEERTVTCETTGGELNTCDPHISELEHDNGTTNYYSADDSGAYSTYGLEGAERVRGEDPTSLEEGQEAEVTIVIQPEKEGAVDKTKSAAMAGIEATGETINSAAERAGDAYRGLYPDTPVEHRMPESTRRSTESSTTGTGDGAPDLVGSSGDSGSETDISSSTSESGDPGTTAQTTSSAVSTESTGGKSSAGYTVPDISVDTSESTIEETTDSAEMGTRRGVGLAR